MGYNKLMNNTTYLSLIDDVDHIAQLAFSARNNRASNLAKTARLRLDQSNYSEAIKLVNRAMSLLSAM
jgi:hypothetical protein